MDLISQLQNNLNKTTQSFVELMSGCQSVSTDGTAGEESKTYKNDQVKSTAEELLKQVIENDLLIHSLPATYGSTADQLHVIGENEKAIEAAYGEMKETQKDAELWQKRLQYVLEQVTTQHLEMQQTASQTS